MERSETSVPDHSAHRRQDVAALLPSSSWWRFSSPSQHHDVAIFFLSFTVFTGGVLIPQGTQEGITEVIRPTWTYLTSAIPLIVSSH